ncbi:ferrous iron transport protein B [Brevibacillus sp. SYSU BS000544]|uniref:ferrous iron transport protein B n=1 Tax=Brevibacillus sp. SYSU BS000544 TaxID=3416443 RepID=UPI003CE4F2E1
MMKIALVGNPNTGKTSLFNTLTGSYEYVGNWAGVTVEKKVGMLKNKQGHLIDLPGIYSLNPLSRDEGVASQFLLTEDFEAILNIVDASQLERNLYLTVQLLEYGKPLLVGLNMVDVAQNRGLDIDHKKLSERLGVPIVPIVARTGKGSNELSSELNTITKKQTQPLTLYYGAIVEKAILRLANHLPSDTTLPVRWLALQFLEGNPIVRTEWEKYVDAKTLAELYQDVELQVKQQQLASSLPHFLRQIRTTFIKEVIDQALVRTKTIEHTFTDRIDAIVTNKYLGMPIFLLFMYLMFKLTFDWVGSPLSDLLDEFISGPLSEMVVSLLTSMGASEFTHALIVDGIIGGVGGVLVFVPQIFMLFFLISFIEDSGYMSRVTIVMDKLMEIVGLNGKSFIPMIIGFGCNVPAVMTARTIEQPKERLLTTLLIPLMSCSARLPVYSLFVGAFFVKNQASVVLSLYVLGIVLALLLAKLFSSTLLRQETTMFIVELPPYRLPQGRTLFRSTWEKGKGFIRKAGTFILGGSVLIWFLSYAGPGGFDVDMNHSFLAMIGGIVAPLLSPIGFGNWQASSALITGFFAKEVVVSTMNIIYNAPDVDSLTGMVGQFFTPLQAFSFMAFVLLYVPCLATVGVIRKETASTRWTLFSISYSLVLAYLISFIIYRGGLLIGLT